MSGDFKLPTESEFREYRKIVLDDIGAAGVNPRLFDVEVVFAGGWYVAPIVRVRSTPGAFKETLYSSIMLGTDGLTAEKAAAQARVLTIHVSYLEEEAAA